jgi:hypothetical protein
MELAWGVESLLQAEKKYRVVLDGNGDHRLQYKFISIAQVGPDTWHFDPRKFPTSEDAERIELYEEYLKNLPKDAVCRELIVKDVQNNLKRFKKMYNKRI